jgi:hypothetical protein
MAGCHHGFLWDQGPEASAEVVRQINASGADMLLVGMGNPKQEQWIARHLHQLEVPLCMGTGGLFDYWVGDLVRAPAWVRAIGYEWLHLLIRQPHKARRYLLATRCSWRACCAIACSVPTGPATRSFDERVAVALGGQESGSPRHGAGQRGVGLDRPSPHVRPRSCGARAHLSPFR